MKSALLILLAAAGLALIARGASAQSGLGAQATVTEQETLNGGVLSIEYECRVPQV